MTQNYCFGRIEVRLAERLVLIGGAPAALGARAFDVLLALIKNRDRIVTKDELLESAWPGLVVEENNLQVQVSALRKLLGQRAVSTVAGRGYQFSLPEEEKAPPVAAAPASPTVARPHLSIVVLPFVNNVGDSGQDYFVDGVTESLTTDLSRLYGSFVIARNTAFTYKGRPADVKQIGCELNVRYVLEGSVQRSGSRIRVNVQLTDAGSGNYLWAEKFEKPLADLLDMQDEITARLANQLGTQLIAADARRAERAPTPDSRDMYLQGMACANKGWTPANIAQARGFFDRALALDPANTDALVGIGLADAVVASNFMCADRAAMFAAAEAALTRASRAAPEHPWVHTFLGMIKIWTNRTEQGIAECEHALTLDPNVALAHAWIGLAKYFIGRSEETEMHVQEALRLSPRDVAAHIWMGIVGYAKLAMGADEEALVWLRHAVEANRNLALSHFGLAAALAHLGRLDDARLEAQAGLALDPAFTINRFRAGASTDNPVYLAGRERFIDGMRQAGVPEE